MEMMRPYLERYPTTLGGYLALQRALIARYVARGGSIEEFCVRLAPVFRRRYAEVLQAGEERPKRAA